MEDVMQKISFLHGILIFLLADSYIISPICAK